MQSGRVVALVSLGLIAVLVAGLVATSGSDPEPAETQSSPTTAAPTPESPSTSDTVEASDTVDSTVASTSAAEASALENFGPHPAFLDVQEWIQTDATSFDAFDGKVRAVQFWTFGCSNCKATFPHMRDLYAKYAGDDFEIIGVHAPEFDFERDVDAVAQAAQDNGLVWPIAIDNDKLNFRSWQDRRFWPRIFLIDADGNVRYDHIGEGAYDEIDAAVGALIDEKNS